MKSESGISFDSSTLHMMVSKYDSVTDHACLQYINSLAGTIHAEVTSANIQRADDALYEANNKKADLIVVPWSNNMRHNRIARQVALSAHQSVLVVKGRLEHPQHLLVCSGGHPISYPVMAMGAWLAKSTGAEATLLHVANAIPSMYTGLDAMEESLEELLERDTPIAKSLRYAAQLFDENNVTTTIELRHGTPVEEIMRSTHLHKYDMIIIGASDAGHPLNRLIMTRVTPRVIDRAPCPVLITRAASTYSAQ